MVDKSLANGITLKDIAILFMKEGLEFKAHE